MTLNPIDLTTNDSAARAKAIHARIAKLLGE